MVTKGKGKVVDRGNRYPKIFIYIPAGLVKDSSFPFSVGDDVSIIIDDGQLILERMESSP